MGGRVQQLTFWNKRAGTLVIQKKDSVSGAMISGAQFQLTYANGGYVDNDNGHLSSNGLYTTDDKGEIRISGIVGTVVAKEVKELCEWNRIPNKCFPGRLMWLFQKNMGTLIIRRKVRNKCLKPAMQPIVVRETL